MRKWIIWPFATERSIRLKSNREPPAPYEACISCLKRIQTARKESSYRRVYTTNCQNKNYASSPFIPPHPHRHRTSHLKRLGSLTNFLNLEFGDQRTLPFRGLEGRGMVESDPYQREICFSAVSTSAPSCSIAIKAEVIPDGDGC